jgi:hypothetical protein
MNKSLLLIGVIILLIFVSLNGCIEEKQLSYKNEYYGFGLNPPEGWNINETLLDPIFIVIFEYFTKDSGVMLGISRPFNIEEQTFEEHINIEIENLSSLTNFSLISINNITINAIEAVEIVFIYNETIDEEGVFGIAKIQTKQIYIKNNGIIYLINFAAVPNDYNRYIDVVDRSIRSFTLF